MPKIDSFNAAFDFCSDEACLGCLGLDLQKMDYNSNEVNSGDDDASGEAKKNLFENVFGKRFLNRACHNSQVRLTKVRIFGIACNSAIGAWGRIHNPSLANEPNKLECWSL